jgi:uncharacterized protein YkwD
MTLRHRLLVLFVMLVFGLSALRADDPKDEPKVKLTDAEQTIFELINKERDKEKLPPLKINPTLTEAARAHSTNMGKKNELNHVLDGKKPTDRVTDAGYAYSWIGENIASTTGEPPTKIVERWMASPAHKGVLLNDKFEETGIGIAKSAKGEIFYTQVFATPKKKP